MEITVLNKTEDAERLICQSGRGDMYSGYIGDTEYYDLMETVDTSEDDRDWVMENIAGVSLDDPAYETPDIDEMSWDMQNEARTRAFIRKQASRGHWGIWEGPSITFAIKGMSVVTERQITRHRHLSFDVQSMRYVDFDDPPMAVPKSLRDPEHQTRADGMVWYDMDSDESLDEQSPDTQSMENARQIYEKAIENSSKAYEAMLELDVPAEDARYALPLGTQVNVTMSGNARTMMHVLNLRQRANAQWEIRELSEKIVEELEDWIPYTAEWWNEKGPVQISP